MAGGGGEQKSLEQTPTWAVAVVSTVFVVISLLVERGIHRLGKRFKKSNQKELFHTLEQIKNELMLLGFISLLLTVFQARVVSICMPERLGHRMLPCPYKPPTPEAGTTPAARRRLFATEAASATGNGCKAGYVPVLSVEGLHQLHIFIFVLAVIHVIYSCLTVLVGLLQVHSWKKWETEAQKDGARVAEELARRKKHYSPLEHKNKNKAFTESRIKYQFLHSSVTGLNLDAYVYSFFRQFGKAIYKEDYLSLRFGFIGAHQLSPDYDFHRYIRRTMEGDFKRVVGISAYLWAFICIFLLLDIDGWYTYFWIAFIPTILVLIVGGKLQHIIIGLAIEVRGGVKKIDLDDLDDGLKKADHGTATEVQPMKPRDDLFWFSRPKLLLKLIHLILFQNAFELAFFFWALFTYGFNSCLVGKRWMIIVRLGMGVFVQILCSASTLPLYALVSQMGSTLKDTVFQSEQTANAIHAWRGKAAQSHKSKTGRHALSHRLGGIIGLNKEKDAEGHVRDIELPHQPHGHEHPHGHERPHGHGQHPQHPHGHPHTHQDESHNVEIDQSPLIIKQGSDPSNPREHDEESQAPPKAASTKPSAFSNITKMALELKEKEKGREHENIQNNDIP